MEARRGSAQPCRTAIDRASCRASAVRNSKRRIGTAVLPEVDSRPRSCCPSPELYPPSHPSFAFSANPAEGATTPFSLRQRSLRQRFKDPGASLTQRLSTAVSQSRSPCYTGAQGYKAAVALAHGRGANAKEGKALVSGYSIILFSLVRIPALPLPCCPY